MIGKEEKPDAKALDAAVIRVLDDMAMEEPGSEKYNELLSDLERLMKLRVNETPSRFSRDTMLTVAGNLLGILIIVAYEQHHAMTTKSLGFVMKPKIE